MNETFHNATTEQTPVNEKLENKDYDYEDKKAKVFKNYITTNFKIRDVD